MKWYKVFDLSIQATLSVLIILAFIFYNSNSRPLDMLIVFALAQIVSIIIHLIIGRQPWKQSHLRIIHHAGTLIVLAIMAFAILKEPKYPNDMSALGLVIYTTIPAILLALFYTVITFIEWKKMKEK